MTATMKYSSWKNGLLAIAFMVITALLSATAQAVYTFDQAAQDAGYDYGSTGTIDVRAMNIDDLAGVNNYTAADSIWVHYNFISRICGRQFAGMTNLQTLYLQRNPISSIECGDFHGLSNLQTLDLSHNQISSIGPSGFYGPANLQTLNLYGNQISSLESGDFHGLSNLQTLNLCGNQISSIEPDDFTGLANLEKLFLDDNQIDDIEPDDFTSLPNLQSLSLYNNQISSIESDDFAGLTNLHELYLPHNPISNIESGAFSGMTNLSRLYMWANDFTHLNLSGADFENLVYFEVAYENPIASLDLSEASLSDQAFHAIISDLIACDIVAIDLSDADLSSVADLTILQSQRELITLDLAFASLPDVNQIDEVVTFLETYTLDNLILSWDQWSSMNGATQAALTDWNTFPDNTLTIVVPGDANCDGVVGEGDAQVLSDNWGKSNADWSMGDLSCDGVVDAFDAAILAANWGAGISIAETVAVPEPTTAALLTLILCSLVLLRQR